MATQTITQTTIVPAAQTTLPPTNTMTPSTLPSPSTLTRRAYLVGMPIAHSQSPLLHHTIYTHSHQKWGQVLAETSDLPSFIAMTKSDPKCMGIGVTMPYKVAVMPLLDELTPEGAAIGAVNTIFFKSSPQGEKVYCGSNTDCVGIRDAFLRNVPDPAMYRGKPGLVVGGGGTSRAAVYTLHTFLGCSRIYMVNRDAKEVQAVVEECAAHTSGAQIIHVENVEQAEQLEAPCAIVGCIPDVPPVTEQEKVVRQILAVLLGQGGRNGALVEMCYHPSPDTALSRLAAGLGWQVIGGIEAMVGQGLEQARLWTGLEVSEALREKALMAVREGLAARHRR